MNCVELVILLGGTKQSINIYALLLCFDCKFKTFCFTWTRGADKSLAQPGRKQAKATEGFDFHISYL